MRLGNVHISVYDRHILPNEYAFSDNIFPSHRNWSTNVILNVDTMVF